MKLFCICILPAAFGHWQLRCQPFSSQDCKCIQLKDFFQLVREMFSQIYNTSSSCTTKISFFFPKYKRKCEELFQNEPTWKYKPHHCRTTMWRIIRVKITPGGGCRCIDYLIAIVIVVKISIILKQNLGTCNWKKKYVNVYVGYNAQVYWRESNKEKEKKKMNRNQNKLNLVFLNKIHQLI